MARRSSQKGRSEVRKFLEDVSVWIDGCWHWIGDRNRDHAGYDCFYHNGKRQLAHRYMWELMNDSAIPAGKIIMHTCDNPICVNPDHLRVGTQRQNVEDMIAKDRANITPLIAWNKSNHQKVTAKLISEARVLKRGGHSYAEIATKLALGVSTVGHMLNTYSRYGDLNTEEMEQHDSAE